jgi:hypothetical protein
LALGEKQNKIMVGTKAGDRFSSNIITSTRNNLEKYISKEWTQFVRRNNLEVGDKLIFNLHKPPTTLMIQTIRSNAHN